MSIFIKFNGVFGNVKRELQPVDLLVNLGHIASVEANKEKIELFMVSSTGRRADKSILIYANGEGFGQFLYDLNHKVVESEVHIAEYPEKAKPYQESQSATT